MIHRLEHGKNDLKTGACDHASRGQPVGLDQIHNISTRSIASIVQLRTLRQRSKALVSID
jgi:hypothetical protein